MKASIAVNFRISDVVIDPAKLMLKSRAFVVLANGGDSARVMYDCPQTCDVLHLLQVHIRLALQFTQDRGKSFQPLAHDSINTQSSQFVAECCLEGIQRVSMRGPPVVHHRQSLCSLDGRLLLVWGSGE